MLKRFRHKGGIGAWNRRGLCPPFAESGSLKHSFERFSETRVRGGGSAFAQAAAILLR